MRVAAAAGHVQPRVVPLRLGPADGGPGHEPGAAGQVHRDHHVLAPRPGTTRRRRTATRRCRRPVRAVRPVRPPGVGRPLLGLGRGVPGGAEPGDRLGQPGRPDRLEQVVDGPDLVRLDRRLSWADRNATTGGRASPDSTGPGRRRPSPHRDVQQDGVRSGQVGVRAGEQGQRLGRVPGGQDRADAGVTAQQVADLVQRRGARRRPPGRPARPPIPLPATPTRPRPIRSRRPPVAPGHRLLAAPPASRSAGDRPHVVRPSAAILTGAPRPDNPWHYLAPCIPRPPGTRQSHRLASCACSGRPRPRICGESAVSGGTGGPVPGGQDRPSPRARTSAAGRRPWSRPRARSPPTARSPHRTPPGAGRPRCPARRGPSRGHPPARRAGRPGPGPCPARRPRR